MICLHWTDRVQFLLALPSVLHCQYRFLIDIIAQGMAPCFNSPAQSGAHDLIRIRRDRGRAIAAVTVNVCYSTTQRVVTCDVLKGCKIPGTATSWSLYVGMSSRQRTEPRQMARLCILVRRWGKLGTSPQTGRHTAGTRTLFPPQRCTPVPNWLLPHTSLNQQNVFL